MKQQVFIVECIVGTEFESVVVRNTNGQLLHAGNVESAKDFLGTSFDQLKTESEAKHE